MIIYRDGKEIRLTLEEIQAAHKQMEHIYQLETAENYFRAKINYEEYENDERWLTTFSQKYGFLPEQAMDPDSPHYAMEELLTLYEELQNDHMCEDSIWDTAVHKLLERKQKANGQASQAGEALPVQIRFYAVMESGFEYSEIRKFEVYPSVKELEEMLLEFKQEAEDMNDEIAVQFGHEYDSLAEATQEFCTNTRPQKDSPVTIPDDLAAQFGTAEGKRKLMAAYGHPHATFRGTNLDGEQVILEIIPDMIKYICLQNDGWVRICWYNAEGYREDETFNGKWKDK